MGLVELVVVRPARLASLLAARAPGSLRGRRHGLRSVVVVGRPSPLGYPRSRRSTTSTWDLPAHGGAGPQGGADERPHPWRDGRLRHPLAIRSPLSRTTRSHRDAKQRAPAPLRTRSVRAYWTTFRVIGSYLWIRLARGFAPTRGSSKLRQRNPATRAASSDDHRAPGPVHQGRPAHLDHGELPPRGVPRELEGLQDGAAAAVRRDRGAHPGGARQALDELFRRFERAHREGIDRPGPRRAAARRQQGRGEGPAPRHRRDRPPRSPHDPPDLTDRPVVRPVAGPRRLYREIRGSHRGARLPRRGEQRRAHRGELRGPHRRRLPARRHELSTARVLTTTSRRREDHRQAGVEAMG